ncbi:MAG: right-handed parallel beta-helix repeat-containing protein [Verrucomicrobiae bacterium]|nr:right-handed parallel beta-helix repeat-containing protein [Verrucomicrobiae bacterium]
MSQIFYLSPHGNDLSDGLSPDPLTDTANGPWKSMAHAMRMIRQWRKNHPGSVRLELRGGIHFLEETLVLDAEDSGTEQAPLTFAAYPGETPVLSGGCRLTGWEVSETAHGPLWTLDLGRVRPEPWTFTQLFVEGVRQWRAMLPKKGWYHFESIPGGPRGYPWYQGAKQAVCKPGEFQEWSHPEDVVVKVLTAWYDQHLRVEQFDPQSRLLTFVAPSLADLHDERGDTARYRVENIREALTEPGEWYLDRQQNRLYYLPLPGQQAGSCDVIAPRLKTLVKLWGTPSAPVRCVRFEKISFRHAEWQYPVVNPGAVQAAFTVPGSVKLRVAEDCSFFGCAFSQMAPYGVEVLIGSRRNRIVGCHFHDLGAGAVKIYHQRPIENRVTGTDALTGFDPVGEGWAMEGAGGVIWPDSRTEVSDCHIHDNGVIFNGAVGIWIGDSSFNHIHHNRIHDQDYTGISCGWSWSYAPTFCIGNRIEFNHVHHIGRGVLSDMGAVYFLGLQPGAVIRGNHIHDVSCYGYGGSGIYPDQGSSLMLITENIVHHTQTQPLSFHYGKSNLVQNNIFALPKGAGVLARGREESVFLATLQRNIIQSTHPEMLAYNWGSALTYHFDNNLYFCGESQSPLFHGAGLSHWRQRGQDRHSLVADPLFADPAKGDFALSPDSPAFTLGFTALDPALAAPRDGVLKAASLDEVPRQEPPERVILEPRLDFGPPKYPDWTQFNEFVSEPVTVYLDRDAVQSVSLGLVNRGGIRAQGRVEFSIFPPEAVTFEGPVCFEYALEPGQRQSFTATFRITGQARLMVLKAEDRAGHFYPVANTFKPRHDQTISRCVPVGSLEQTEEVLGGHTAQPLDFESTVLGEVRMAVTPADLLLMLDARETRLEVNPAMPWMGSSMEIFSEDTSLPSGCRQYIVYPAAANTPAGATKTDHVAGRILPEPRIEACSRPTDTGYRLCARVPLELLGISPGAESFKFDLFLHAHPTGESGPLQAKLFGLSFSWMGTDSWGIVHVRT